MIDALATALRAAGLAGVETATELPRAFGEVWQAWIIPAGDAVDVHLVDELPYRTLRVLDPGALIRAVEAAGPLEPRKRGAELLALVVRHAADDCDPTLLS